MSLLNEIELFMKAHNISKTKFGELALNDRHLVRQMRDEGRRLWPETEAKVRAFMLTFAADREAA